MKIMHVQQCQKILFAGLLFVVMAIFNQAFSQVLVFSKTAAFRHDSIPDGQAMLQSIASNNNWSIDFTENSAQFNSANLSQYAVVVWLSTTGDVLNDAEQAAFESYIEGGGGYVGIHAASDTEYDWPWYGDLVGAYFNTHPPGTQTASIDVEDSNHESTDHLGSVWSHTDEWYGFQSNPRGSVNVLMTLDETSYSAGSSAMGDHPIAWYHTVGLGKAFYTGLGHTSETYSTSNFQAHIEGALTWAGNLTVGVPVWTGPPPPNSDFSVTTIASGIHQPLELDISANGDLYIIGREGHFYAMEGGIIVEKSVITVDSTFELEGGLIGFTLDPDFINNRHAYFHYSNASQPENLITRMIINSDNTLNFGSESVLLRYPVQKDECCHESGSLDFDTDGNLYIATGDNTHPSGNSSGYAPIDERAGRSPWDAQKSSSNTNDLRGKVLRITPTASGGYTIPNGNLFTADGQHRAEIYTMGHRNPYRIAVDQETNILYLGDIGPDANSSDPDRGPSGYDELNRVTTAGNFGWPYFAGDNEAYNEYDFATGISGPKYDPVNVINNSPNNTGARNIPSPIPAWIKMSHRALMVGGVYRWNSSIQDPFKLPSYFHGRLIYWNFNNDQMFEADTNSVNPTLRNWLDTTGMDGIMDGVISPADNRLYLITFGGNCCARPDNAGGVFSIQYTGSGPSDAFTSYAVNSGSTLAYNGTDGVFYFADGYSSGGSSHSSTGAIAGTEDDIVYQTHHWQSGGFSYNFPVENGTYNVTLKFAETFFTAPGSRVFDVNVENAQVINDLDLVAVAGTDVAHDRTFSVIVSDGSLDIEFIAGVQNPLVSGIVFNPPSDFPAGTIVSIKAGVNNRFVTVSDGDLIASSLTADTDEYFEIVDGGSNLIALKSLSNNQYVSAADDGLSPLIASANSVGSAELFELIKNANGTYAFRADINDLYVVAEDAGDSSLIADRDAVNAWEQFIVAAVDVCEPSVGYAIECRPEAAQYLNMPQIPNADLSNVPITLSLTGAFSNTETLEPSASLIPFALIAPLWSDRAVKSRWVSVPSGEKITWAEQGKWGWPAGTVLVKHFDLPIDESNPSLLQRLETRLVVIQPGGTVYGVTYKWRSDNTDADLLTSSLTEDIIINSPTGDWVQTWTYPSPTDCLICHNQDATGVLGPKTASLNKDFLYPSGVSDNQLRTWNHLNLFSTTLDEAEVSTYPAHANINDSSASLEHRVRSYWDSNCSSCHGPQGIASLWDARYDVPLDNQGIINGPLANQRDYLADYGLAAPFVVAPSNQDNSILYIRDKSVDPDDRMPPLARSLEDENYIAVLGQWINSLGGGISATASTDDGNGPVNVLDGNPDTRWSANGDSEWLQLDLGSSQQLLGINIAFFRGDQRTSTFDIQTSSDGSSWNTVLSGITSSGNTLELEAFNFNALVNARYIRYVGHGNSINSWNSLTQVSVISDPGLGARIPGRLEAEDYTAQSGIQTQSTDDDGNGLNVGWIQNGDWVEYAVNVQTSGSYAVNFRVASAGSGGAITLLSNGSNVGSVSVSNTGGWQSWITVSTTVNLNAGSQTLRMLFSGGNDYLLNYNWGDFSGGE